VSLRTRLLLAVLAASVTGLAIAGVLTFTLVTRAQLEQVDQELERAHPPIERAAASASGVVESRSWRRPWCHKRAPESVMPRTKVP